MSTPTLTPTPTVHTHTPIPHTNTYFFLVANPYRQSHPTLSRVRFRSIIIRHCSTPPSQRLYLRCSAPGSSPASIVASIYLSTVHLPRLHHQASRVLMIWLYIYNYTSPYSSLCPYSSLTEGRGIEHDAKLKAAVHTLLCPFPTASLAQKQGLGTVHQNASRNLHLSFVREP